MAYVGKYKECENCKYRCWYSDSHRNDPCYYCNNASNYKKDEDNKK